MDSLRFGRLLMSFGQIENVKDPKWKHIEKQVLKMLNSVRVYPVVELLNYL